MYGQQQPGQIGYIQTPAGICLKYSSMVHQIMMLITGSIVLGFGIWLAMWTTSTNNIGVVFGNAIYMAGYALFIVIGIIILVISIVGCCGSQQENACLLLSFLIVIIILFVGLIASATFGFIFNNQIQHYSQQRFTTVIEKYYGVNLANAENKELTTAMDDIQKTFQCCGAHGNTNSSHSWSIYRTSSPWYEVNKEATGPPFVPESCCVLGTDGAVRSKDICQGRKAVPNTAGKRVAPTAIAGGITASNPYLHENGCYNAILTSAGKNAITVGGVGVAFAIYLFLGIILVFCLLYSLEHAKFAHHLEQKDLAKGPMPYKPQPISQAYRA